MNKSVEQTLDGYFKKPLRKLPEFQLRVVQYHIKNWNGLSESERRKKAQTIDICRQTKKRLTLERYESRALQITEAGHHPRLQGFPTRYERRAPQITEAEQQKYLSEFEKAWQLDNEIEDIQSEIDERKSTPTLGQVELDLKNVRISELEAKKAELERQYLALKGEVPESMPVVQPPDETEAVVPVANETTAMPEAVTGGPEPTAPAWSLIPTPARLPGYRWPLYQFLKEEHTANKPCPKAQYVLDAWKSKPPHGLKVVQVSRLNELEYEIQTGTIKRATAKQIQSVINDLLSE